jgi:hypothetical protein
MHYTLGRRVNEVPINKLKPSPENEEIYRRTTDTNTKELQSEIKERGLDDPLIATRDYFILSGHRRYKACECLGMETIKVRYLSVKRSDMSTDDYRKLLAKYNSGQREKTTLEKVREKQSTVDLKKNYREYAKNRDQGDSELTPVRFQKQIIRSQISHQKSAMVDSVIKIVNNLREYWPLTDRTIHYGLLNNPPLMNLSRLDLGKYKNIPRHYQNLCQLLTRMRLQGYIPFECISDDTRTTIDNHGWIDVSRYLAEQASRMLAGYHRDLMQGQDVHLEIVIEKLTVFNFIKSVAAKYKVPCTVSRGNSGIDSRYKMANRFIESGKREFKLLIFSDFDPDGEMIAGTWQNSLRSDFGIHQVDAFKVALNDTQANKLDLVSNGIDDMKAKKESSNFKRWVKEYGENQTCYELEAMQPKQLQDLAEDAIKSSIDMKIFNEQFNEQHDEAGKLEALRQDLKLALNELVPDYFE